MNIADILAPKPPPTIDAARVTTHTLDDNETKENDMSRATDIANTIIKLGGRASGADIKHATGLDDKPFWQAIYLAKKAGMIERDGDDYIIAAGTTKLEIGAPGTKAKITQISAKASTKPVTAKKKPATKAKKTATPKAEKAQPKTPSFNDVSNVSSVERITSPSTPCPADAEAYVLRDGSVLIIEDGMRIHLTESQYIAVLNTKE